MSHRLNEYFASEASEYLDQLEQLLTDPGVPDTDQFLRLSTGVRGSAQMAGASTVASVAERLEDAVRSIISSNIAWSEEIRELSRQTVGDLKLLVRALNRWGHDEERRVREALLRWDDLEVEAPDEPDEPVPVESLFYDGEGPHIVAVGTEPARGSPVLSNVEEAASDQGEEAPMLEVVDIASLLFRGEAALREALTLRGELERAVGEGEGAGGRPIEEVIDEIFDLIKLGLSPMLPEV
jgi:chemotaxis protein histidine kinase CheA